MIEKMKIQKMLLLAVAMCSLFMATGCEMNRQLAEDYTGTWAQEDIGWETGGMVMDISKMQDMLKVEVTKYEAALDMGCQSFATKFLESDIKDGFISVEFEGDDCGGYTGTIELQFNGKRGYCEIKNLKYADTELSSMALISEGTTTVVRMDDAYDRLECPEGANKGTASDAQSQEKEVVQNESSGATTSAWAQVYRDYIQEGKNWNSASVAKECEYCLFDANGDGIPELCITGPNAAAGRFLCTYANGNIDSAYLNGNGWISYIPGKNLILDSGGHMDSYYDTIYRIEAGHLVVVNSGYYGAEDNCNVQCDENDHPIYQYFWNDKEVSEAIYFEQLNSIFPSDKAVGDDYEDYDWQNYYEILETLS